MRRQGAEHKWKWIGTLRPQPGDARREESVGALRGVRHPARAADRLLHVQEVGEHLHRLLERVLEKAPPIHARCLSAIGAEDPQAGPSEEKVVGAGRC